MGKKRKKDTAYRAAVSGAKGVLRILVYICAILLIIFAGKTAYSFGYLIFDDHPMVETKEDGQDVTVVIYEDDDVYRVGQTLQEKGLIERPVIFGCRKNFRIIGEKLSRELIFSIPARMWKRCLLFYPERIQKVSRQRMLPER